MIWENFSILVITIININYMSLNNIILNKSLR